MSTDREGAGVLGKDDGDGGVDDAGGGVCWARLVEMLFTLSTGISDDACRRGFHSLRTTPWHEAGGQSSRARKKSGTAR